MEYQIISCWVYSLAILESWFFFQLHYNILSYYDIRYSIYKPNRNKCFSTNIFSFMTNGFVMTLFVSLC